ncbi:MAG: AFG1/ZapE family ATPase, partial [Oceanococcus sp.]
MNKPTPAQRYQFDLQREGFIADAAQARAVAVLEDIYQELRLTPPKSSFLQRLRRTTAWPQVRGVYLWGGVGRGKTWLMDCFYETLDLPEKRRLHFHRFMQDVHKRTKDLGHVS